MPSTRSSRPIGRTPTPPPTSAYGDLFGPLLYAPGAARVHGSATWRVMPPVVRVAPARLQGDTGWPHRSGQVAASPRSPLPVKGRPCLQPGIDPGSHRSPTCRPRLRSLRRLACRAKRRRRSVARWVAAPTGSAYREEGSASETDPAVSS